MFGLLLTVVETLKLEFSGTDREGSQITWKNILEKRVREDLLTVRNTKAF